MKETEFGVEPGWKGTDEMVVTDRNTAHSLSSGALEVYATPYMIALMEGAAVAAVDPRLPAGWSTVGTTVDIEHRAATPRGMKVRAEAELLEVDGRALKFRVEAWDEVGQIGVGTHGRFIVNNEKFVAKAEAKRGK